MTERNGLPADDTKPKSDEPFSGVSAWLDRWAVWMLRHRAVVLAVIAAVTIGATVVSFRAPYRGEIVEAFIEDLAEYDAYRRRSEEFGGDSDELIFVGSDEGDTLFTPAKLDAIRAAAAELAQFPEVDRVACLSDAPYIPVGRLSVRQTAVRSAARRKLLAGTLDTTTADLEIAPYWPADPSRQAAVDTAELRRRACSDPLVRETFVTADGTGQGMVVRLKSAVALSLPVQVSLRPRIEHVLKSHGLGRDGVHVVGMVVAQGWIFGEMQRAIQQIMPLGALVLAVILWILFERIGVVLVSAVTAWVAIVWSIGFAALYFGQLSVLVAAAPLMILVIITAETVFLTTAYRHESSTGYGREEALRKVVREVGGACTLTGITTFIGFASLAFVGSPAMQHMALTVAVGVAVGLLLSLTLVPILYSFLAPFPPHVEERPPTRAQRAVRLIVGGCRRVALTWPKTVIAAGVAVMIAGIAASWNLKIDPDIPKRFSDDHPLPTAVRFFNDRMSGATYLELFLTAPEGYWSGPDAIRTLVDFEQRVQELPEVRSVHSLLDLYRTTDRAVGFGTADHLPPTSTAAESALRLAERIDEESVRLFVNDRRDRVRVLVQTAPCGFIAVCDLGDRIGGMAAKSFPGEVHAEVLGSYPIVGKVVKQIIYNYFNGNWLCTIAIWLMTAWGLGSIRVAAWAMFPNLLPMALLGAMLVLTLDVLDSDLLIIPMTALGIAVDDTIHFVHRYRLGLEQTGDPERALNETFHYAGDAVLQTTVLLSAGLAPYALSPFLSIWMLGTYMVYTLLFAVLADLLLTPAMAKVGLFHWKGLPRPVAP